MVHFVTLKRVAVFVFENSPILGKSIDCIFNNVFFPPMVIGPNFADGKKRYCVYYSAYFEFQLGDICIQNFIWGGISSDIRSEI